jgi:threonine dehydratase
MEIMANPWHGELESLAVSVKFIYIVKVSKGREQAIAKFGCEMVRISGNYDDSVRQADMDSREK